MQKILLTGGGSAGHVVPNLALIPSLKEKYELCYAGTDAIEKKLLQGRGIPFYTFSAPKLVRGSLLRNLALPFRFLRGLRQAGKILDKARPDLVFSKGGYVALPVVMAAKRRKIPVISHESDLSAGLANRLIAKRCATVLTSFPDTAKHLKNGKYSGSPVREELFRADRAAARKKYGFSDSVPVLLLFGGGSGSAVLNRAADEALAALLQHFQILHIRGKNDGARPRTGYVPVGYEQDMASAYACADFVLSRAGSNTVFEILALKKPALLVPLENNSTRGDQVQNAEYFEKRGLCHVLHQKDLSAGRLQEELLSLCRDSDLQARLARAPFRSGNDAILAEIEKTLARQREQNTGAEKTENLSAAPNP